MPLAENSATHAPRNRARTRIGIWLERPLSSFHLVVAIAALLLTLGLTMVLSASAVESYANDGSSYTFFTQQVIGVALGVIAFYVALITPVRILRKYSFPAFLVSLVMLILVLIPGIGAEIQGSRRWFALAGISFQPSEFAKIALILWGSQLLSIKYATRRTMRDFLTPLAPSVLLMCLLVILQPNLSTAITLAIISLSLLWYAGYGIRAFSLIVIAGIGSAIVLTFAASYRSDRLRSLFDPDSDPQGLGYQARQAKFALADGGIFGKGLGQSTTKWNYLPNSYNDFIFSIIGEELGLIGCLGVIGLFAALAYTGIRISVRSSDPFLRILSATATTWICSQAAINIGYVVGLLPVTGLQLPLISYGGTSTALMLFMFGILANAARHEPDATSSIIDRHATTPHRMCWLPLPEPYPRLCTQKYRQIQSAATVRKTAQESVSNRNHRIANLTENGMTKPTVRDKYPPSRIPRC
ncbi:putative lipid II flippase FtsW [Rhodococcus erythropolis]|uniref:putative lipid II flippase FtsW n=1 Tax=Rhodococcus erythropolis TaxID=1833 RepID=UPI002948FE77|nr:putative lipid II flippase FtsW [Rhodococcus erythropolis]MDV6278547.1 putative lipid II flippase FtsW [Rhodococcus erythropolis]